MELLENVFREFAKKKSRWGGGMGNCWSCSNAHHAAIFPVARLIPRRAPSVTAPRFVPCRARFSSLCTVPRPFPPEGHDRGRRCGRRDARPQQGDVVMKAYVSSALDVSEICCNFF
jgi:hypothetical protein